MGLGQRYYAGGVILARGTVGRGLSVSKLARVVAWLVGDESEWVNGQVRRLAYLGPSMSRVNRRPNQLLEQRSSWKLKSEAKFKQRFKDDSAYVSENRTLGKPPEEDGST